MITENSGTADNYNAILHSTNHKMQFTSLVLAYQVNLFTVVKVVTVLNSK